MITESIESIKRTLIEEMIVVSLVVIVFLFHCGVQLVVPNRDLKPEHTCQFDLDLSKFYLIPIQRFPISLYFVG